MVGQGRLFTKLLFFIFLLSGTTGAIAAESTPKADKTVDKNLDKIDELNLEDLMNIEVTSASKQKQKQYEAPATLSVIARDQFYDYGYFTLNDAISHEAGFFASHDYDRQTLGSRGLFEGWNNNHLLLLIDGVPFNDPMYGSAYTWENTPTFMIKSVEVIRGPGSALYGTNATNGVIGVQTLSGADMKGKAEGRVRAGSYDSRWMEAYTGNVSGNFNYFTGFSSYTSRGNSYQSYDGTTPLAKKTVRDDQTAQYMMFKVLGEHELKGLSVEFHDQQWTFQTGHGWYKFQIPDFQDAMVEHRQVLTTSYKPNLTANLQSEFTLKYERKEIDWNTRYNPADATYPNGVTEYVDFTHENFFGRGQLTYDLGERANILAGIESSTFVYNGDRSHYSNTDLSGAFGGLNGYQNAPPILGLIAGKPITNVGVYTQVMSGDRISKVFQLTGGLRYDIEQVNHGAGSNSLSGNFDKGSRTFKQLSPRLAAVMQPNDRLSFKAMFGRAFRAPSPSELAGTNTWALANNIKNLEPETVTTFEAGADWRPDDRWNFKANAYHTKAADQIGYSGVSNLSTNIYTTTTVGGEFEASYSVNRTKSFANASYSQRIGEDVKDKTVTGTNDTVTWAPSFTSNIGISQNLTTGIKGTLLAEYVGEIRRRDSDNLTPANSELRGLRVPAYLGVDASLGFQFTKSAELNVYVKNLFDKRGYLVKTNDYSFDYQRDGRTYYAAFTLSL